MHTQVVGKLRLRRYSPALGLLKEVKCRDLGKSLRTAGPLPLFPFYPDTDVVEDIKPRIILSTDRPTRIILHLAPRNEPGAGSKSIASPEGPLPI